MFRPTPITYCSFVIGFILGFLCMPENWIISENIKYLTGFVSVYSAGIFPSITLLINMFNPSNLSPKNISNYCEDILSSIESLFYILLSSLLFVLFVFLSNQYKDAPLIWHIDRIHYEIFYVQAILRGFSIAFFAIATVGALYWLPLKIKSLVEIKFSSEKEKAKKEARKAREVER